MAMLDKRLKRMEERVIKYVPKQDLAEMANITRATVKPALPGQTPKTKPPPANKKRTAEEAFVAEMNDWTKTASKDKELSQLPRTQIVSRESKLLTEGAEHLPSMEIQEHLAEVFFDYIYGQAYLLLHKPSFMRKLKAKTVPPVLILAICAISARFSTHPQINTQPAFQRGRVWAEPAEKIVLSRHDEPNITILIVLLILGLHEFGTCHGGKSWSFGGMALRMAYALQLHRELDHDPLARKGDQNSELSFTDREIRRRTMWACFMMDRFNSSGSDRPPIGNEDFLNIQLPIKEPHFELEIPGPTEDLDGNVRRPVPPGIGQVSNPRDNMGVSAYIIRAIVLWGRITNYVNLGGKKKDPHPIWSPLSKHKQLKQQVEEFVRSLPPSFAFTPENLQNHAADRIANQFLFLHIVNYQNMLFLHRFAIPTSPGAAPPKEMPKAFLGEAARTAVDAANQISALIEQSSNYVLTVPFAGYCVYVSSTVHIWGNFSKNAQLEQSSKENLRHNYKYLNNMKKYWGMFHYMALSVRDLYRHFADATLRGQPAPSDQDSTSSLFQYGDWFDKYPHGVTRLDFEDGEPEKKDSSSDAVMSQSSNLQSVEQFFRNLSPPPEQSKKLTKAQQRKNLAKTAQARGAAAAKPADQRKAQPAQDSHPQRTHSQSIGNQGSGQHAISPTISGTPANYGLPQQVPPPRTDMSGLPNTQFPNQQVVQSQQPPAQSQPFYANPLSHLDRQFVFGAYNSMEAMNSPVAQNSMSPDSQLQAMAGSGLWNAHDLQDLDPSFLGDMGHSASAGGGLPNEHAASWFVPFNLEIPVSAPDHNQQSGLLSHPYSYQNNNTMPHPNDASSADHHAQSTMLNEDAAAIFDDPQDTGSAGWALDGYASGALDGYIASGIMSGGQGTQDDMAE